MEFPSILDLEQWKLLLVVSPLFASDITWRARLETGPPNSSALSMSRRELLEESLLESAALFKVCVHEIPAYVPSNHVFSEPTYYPFIVEIDHLLRKLDGLIRDDIIYRENQTVSISSRCFEISEILLARFMLLSANL